MNEYWKLWVGFEPTTTQFHSDALTDWAITPWIQLALRANLVKVLQLHRLFSVRFHFGFCLRQSPRLFYLKFSWCNHILIQMVFTTKILWSSYRKLAWVGFEPTITESRSDFLGKTWCYFKVFAPKFSENKIRARVKCLIISLRA